jgi:hypothetical protein
MVVYKPNSSQVASADVLGEQILSKVRRRKMRRTSTLQACAPQTLARLIELDLCSLPL